MSNRNYHTVVEVLLILVIVFIGPVIRFTGIFSHNIGVLYEAAGKFPFATLHPLQRIWTPWDAVRAAIFFVSLAAVGFVPPLRSGMRVRWALAFIFGCWVISFLFVPGVHGMANSAERLEHFFHVNACLSLLWTALFVASWVKAQKILPPVIAGAMALPLWMTAHALMSFFYVFSLR